MSHLAILLFVLLSIAPQHSNTPAGDTITQDELVRRSQELFDSVAPGNEEPFKNISPKMQCF